MDINNIEFSKQNIIVVGTIFVDIKGYPEGVFIPQGRNAGRIEYKSGGVARNVAEDLAGIGCKPVFISLSDTQGPGATIVPTLKEAGVNTDYVMEVPDGIGTWMAIFTPDGDVCANLSKRQDLMPLCDVLDEKGEEAFSNAAAVLLEMDVEEDVVRRVFDLAEKFHIDVYGVISNMTIAMERMDYIKRTRCFICNRQEAGMFFGTETLEQSADDLLVILKNGMKDLGIRNMVVTMDKDGAVYADENGDAGYCPAIKTDIVDSTGAGDSFFAGVSAGLISGLSLKESCSAGTQMASVVIQSTDNVYKKA